MSTPSITAPGRAPGSRDHASNPPSRLSAWSKSVVRGRESDPVWSRPLLWLVAVVAGVLTLWGLTRNGYANTYYAEAAQAASRSWSAWFTNALDVSGSDSLDKGPLPNMIMGLSGRILGFSSIGAVLALHNTVRRTLGPHAAILAAAMLALTPIFVAMSRFNNPDAVLVLSEVAAAWALVRALESGRTRHMLLCGLFIGLAFNTKMLAGYLIVPGLALTFAIAGQGRLRRRLAQLLAGAGAMLAVSFAWYGMMTLLPAADRPWVGDTTDNSWFSLIFGANGLGRVDGNTGGPSGSGGGFGGGGGGSFGGSAGLLRLFNSIVGGQIAWLLPLALLGLALGLWMHRRAPRTDPARSAYLLWGGWAVVTWAIFSFSKGVFHPYYTTALAPAVAVLAAGALTTLWDRSRHSTAWSVALALTLIGTSVLAAALLGRVGGFSSWLAPATVALAAVACVSLLIARLSWAQANASMKRWLAVCAATAGLVAVLAGPGSYALATVGKTLNGSNPLAGPTSAASSGFAGGPAGGMPGGRAQFRSGSGMPGGRGQSRPGSGAGGGGRPPGAPPSAELFGGGPASAGQGGAASARGGTASGGLARADGLPGGLGRPGAAGGVGQGANVSKVLVKYLEAHQGSARYLVAAVGSSTAGSIALQSGRDVVNMGGFMGSDPAPSLTKLKHLISTGQLRYVLLGGGQGGAGLGGPGGNSTLTQERESWIKSHGTITKVTGQSSTGGSTTLYRFSSSG
jgi:4-amino-4-deoxy-L-arabinose transferase-like glycosyltransferase